MVRIKKKMYWCFYLILSLNLNNLNGDDHNKDDHNKDYHNKDNHNQDVHEEDGLFCHDQVSSGTFLAFFNLLRNLHMFLDTMEPRTENKNSSLEKNCYDNVSSGLWNNCLNCP